MNEKFPVVGPDLPPVGVPPPAVAPARTDQDLHILASGPEATLADQLIHLLSGFKSTPQGLAPTPFSLLWFAPQPFGILPNRFLMKELPTPFTLWEQAERDAAQRSQADLAALQAQHLQQFIGYADSSTLLEAIHALRTQPGVVVNPREQIRLLTDAYLAARQREDTQRAIERQLNPFIPTDRDANRAAERRDPRDGNDLQAVDAWFAARPPDP